MIVSIYYGSEIFSYQKKTFSTNNNKAFIHVKGNIISKYYQQLGGIIRKYIFYGDDIIDIIKYH